MIKIDRKQEGDLMKKEEIIVSKNETSRTWCTGLVKFPDMEKKLYYKYLVKREADKFSNKYK